jgi:hypothetical protein
MKKLALALIAFTLWVDVCLMVGVFFTGTYGHAKIVAQITVGSCSVDSQTPGGAAFIMFIAVWTALLALGGLAALRAPRLLHKVATR